MAKIYLVRHCEAEGNASRRTQARVDGLVTRKGYEQCQVLRRRFQNIHIDRVYSSDAFRSIATAEPIAQEHHVPVRVKVSLREVSTGVWEDMAWGNIADEYPEANRAWSETPWAIITPGASNFQQVAERTIYGLRQIAKEIGPQGTAVAVSHSCTIKATLCAILGRPMEEVKSCGHGDNTSVSLLEVDEAGNITAMYTNDDSHLPDRLKRSWSGVAGADINMSVYPVKLPEQERMLLHLAEKDAEQRGEAFDPKRFLERVQAALEWHPGSVALSFLKGEPSGYILMEQDSDLPEGYAVIRRMYVRPDLQGKGFCEQLFGYASHALRYRDLGYVAVAADCTTEEQRVVDSFTFEKMKGHPEYMSLKLFCPPCPYPILA